MIRLDLDLIRHALTTASDRGFASVELCLGDDKFEAKLLPRRVAKRVATSNEAPEKQEFKKITASAVGYYRPSKTSVEIGSTVESGDVVAEIVSLGLVNEVTSKWSGKVVEIFVTRDQPVEYGQVIATLDVANE